MTVRLVGDATIVLDGACPAEDADVLLQHLISVPEARVDWRTCEAVHTAVVQVLMASEVDLLGPPAGPFLRASVAPVLARAQRGSIFVERPD